MKIQKTSPGFAHVGLVVVAVVALLGVLGYVGYNALTKKGNVAQSSSQKADAAGAATCGSGYKLMHKIGSLYNYKNAAGKGCALYLNDQPGRVRNLVVEVIGGPADSGKYKYYAGPIYYTHKPGVKLRGCVTNGQMGYCVDHKITSN